MKTLVWKNLTAEEKAKALTRPAVESRWDIAGKVSEILTRVRTQGDTALRELTAKLDGVTLDKFEVTADEFRVASEQVSKEAKAALRQAAANIEAFHAPQIPEAQSTESFPGVICERQSRPIARVGLYAPGGTASLPSTVLMLGVPSRLAGCKVRVLCTPPRKDGTVDPYVLEAARICGIERVFKLGGAQAIAAMAYGTPSVPKVEKIFGPGNSWVTEAKEQVAKGTQMTGIDMPAGPSEVLVIADKKANPRFVAADLLSQAEHGADSQVVLVTDSQSVLKDVEKEIRQQLVDLPRATIAASSLQHGLLIVVDSIDEAMQVSNDYAPEHLIVQVENAGSYREQIVNAGSVFLGPWSPESAGDYASGTNHVLPTYGHARLLSGVSIDSFLKHITFQELSSEGILGLGPTIETLATIEKLDAHRRAVTYRLEALRRTEVSA